MERLELRDLFFVMWSKRKLILLVTVIFGIIGSLYSFFLTVPKYKAYTSLVLVKIQDNQEVTDSSISQSDISMNQNLISTYSELITSNKVIKQVKSNLSINKSEYNIKKNITVSNIKNTEMLEITVSDKNANDAKLICDELAKVFIEEVRQIYNINNIHIVDTAEVPENPYNINHMRDILLFLLLGFLLINFYIVIRSMVNNAIEIGGNFSGDNEMKNSTFEENNNITQKPKNENLEKSYINENKIE